MTVPCRAVPCRAVPCCVQVKLLQFMTNGQIRAAQRLYAAQQGQTACPALEGDDFLSAILRSQARGVADAQQHSAIWGHD
jgi:hypothetical protein